MPKLNYSKVKNSLCLLDKQYNIKHNVIKISEHETLEHFLAKCLLAYEALKLGKTFVTEAIFTNRKRADIFILEDCEAWEILGSESIKQFKENKENKYPCEVLSFKATEVIKQNIRKFGKKIIWD